MVSINDWFITIYVFKIYLSILLLLLEDYHGLNRIYNFLYKMLHATVFVRAEVMEYLDVPDHLASLWHCLNMSMSINA